MNNNSIIRVKICCISSIAEAKLALSYGATALGFVSHMPSGPGVISEQKILEIIETIPDGIDTFLLTSEVKAGPIMLQQKKFRPKTLQLVDEVDINVYDELIKELQGVNIVQVVHVIDGSSVDYAVKVSDHVNGILLDSGNPDLSIKELGGTGRVHNWNISRKIREAVNVPVYLAGGLNPGNVRKAIETVQPYGVDLCSGVRTDGELDGSKLKKFFEAVLDS
jgi:phosphoribosylanthranilate isomerase